MQQFDVAVPLYENFVEEHEKEGSHCVQASVRMVLGYFLPEKDFSWVFLDGVSAKQKGKATWEMALLLWLESEGFEVVRYTDFDYELFSRQGIRYIVQTYGNNIATWQEENSDITVERKRAIQFQHNIKTINRPGTIDDIKNALQQGYLVIADVDGGSLSNKKSYYGHAVVVKGYDNANIIINDPGPPGKKDKVVSYDQFMKAWAAHDHCTMDLIRLRR